MFPKKENLTKYKVVFFDLDNTLYEYQTCHTYALDISLNEFSFWSKLDIDSLFIEYDLARKKVHHQLHGQASSHSRLLYFKVMLENLNLNEYIDKAYDFHQYYWSSFVEKMEWNPLAKNLIEELKSENVKLAIITDLTTDVQMLKIKKLKLSKYFFYIITSEEVGIEKPNRQIFEYALKMMNCNANEACLIGDNIKTDGGCQELGIDFFLVDNSKNN
jgi:HAD superfamily hydrolase (TIGR01549 family)